MKKTFRIEDSHIKADRQIDSFRHQIKKYFARERRKKIPEDFDCWSFDCRFGYAEESAQPLKEAEIKDKITEFRLSGKDSFYLEILARADNKKKERA